MLPTIALRAQLRLAHANGTHGRTADAEAHLRAAEQLVVPDTPYAQADKAVGLAYNRAIVEQWADRVSSTLEWLPASIAACEASFGRDSPRCGDLKIQRTWALMRYGDADQAVAHAEELAPMMTQAKASYGRFAASYVLMRVFAAKGLTDPHLLPTATLERLLQPDAAQPLQLQFQLPAMAHLAIMRLRAGEIEQAQQWFDRADALVATLAEGQLPEHAAFVGTARGLLLQARGEHAAALTEFGELCDAPSGLGNSLNSLNCVRSLVALERKPQALTLVRHVVSMATASLGPDAPNTRRARQFLKELEAPGYPLPPWDGSQIFISGIR